MQARDIMTTNVISVAPDATVQDIATRLIENRISAVPVVEKDGRLIGIVSEGDLMRRPESGTERLPSWWLALLTSPEQAARAYVKAHGKHAVDVMTRDVATIEEDAPIRDIAEILEKHRIKRVPVMKSGKIVGIVSRANLLRALANQQAVATKITDDRDIKEAVEKSLNGAGIRTSFVNIIVSGGVVNLWGSVETPEEKTAVRIAAETATGVKEVHDNIGVLPSIARAVMWGE